MACRHTTAAVDDRLVATIDLAESVAEFSNGAMQPISIKIRHVMKVLSTRDVACARIKGFDLTPITLGRSRIDHGASCGNRSHHLVGGDDAGPCVGHLANDVRSMSDLGRERASLTRPCLNPAVEHGDVFMADGSQHPPQTSCHRAASIVVDDYEAVRCNTKRTDRACEALGGG